MRVYMLAAVSLAVAGCTTIKNNYVPETKQISFPNLNEVRTASLGEELVKQGTATTTRGAELGVSNNIRGVVLSPGFYPQIGEDKDHIFTSFATNGMVEGMGRVTMNSSIFGSNVYPQSIRFHKTKRETCIVGPGAYGITQASCDTEYSYQFTTKPIISANNFQQTLIYSGRVGDRIRVSYRESSGNMARPAFSNEAEYDLSNSDIIAYRGARLRVLQADNESIRYEVLSNFNTD